MQRVGACLARTATNSLKLALERLLAKPCYPPSFSHLNPRRLGAQCELVSYKGAGHGFFNANRGEQGEFRDILARLGGFFVDVGWLHEDPTR